MQWRILFYFSGGISIPVKFASSIGKTSFLKVIYGALFTSNNSFLIWAFSFFLFFFQLKWYNEIAIHSYMRS